MSGYAEKAVCQNCGARYNVCPDCFDIDDHQCSRCNSPDLIWARNIDHDRWVREEFAPGIMIGGAIGAIIGGVVSGPPGFIIGLLIGMLAGPGIR